MTITRSITSSITGSITSSISGIATRLVYDFDGIDDYITIPTKSIAAGEVIYCTLEKITDTKAFLGGQGSTTRAFSLTGNDIELAYDGGGGSWTGAISSITVGTLYDIEFLVELSTIELLIDGVSQGTVPHTLNNLLINRIGSNQVSSSNYQGKILNVGVASSFYPINDGWGVNPLVVDTLSGQNGTANNFNEERWVNV